MFPTLIGPLAEGRDFEGAEAEALMRYLMSGEATESQIGGVLLAMRVKGVTVTELASFAKVMREKADTLEHSFDNVVDTCGTGGGSASFNISTAAAIVSCAAGVRIAKHGNRGVTSKCGSADVLEALGVRITNDSGQLLHMLEKVGIVFMFAPSHHPAMRHVGQARRELGVRTVFNQLGPLANPANAKRQLIGVYDPSLMPAMGEALALLGTERALLAHGDDGLDEISPVTETFYVKVWEGNVTSGKLRPSDFGLDPVPPDWIACGKTLAENASILLEAVSDANSPRARVILPSAAAAIWIAGIEEELPAAVERSRRAIESGAAGAKLKEMVDSGAAL